MSKGRIDSIIDREAILKEKTLMINVLDDIEAKLGDIKDIKISIAGAQNFKDLGAATKEYNDIIAKTKQSTKDLADVQARLVEVQTKLADSLVKQEQGVSDLSAAQIKLLSINKEIDAATKNALTINSKRNVLSTEYGKALVEERFALQKANAEAKTQVQINQSGTGSLDNLNARLKKLRAEKGSLVPNTAEDIAAIDKLKGRIDNLEQLRAKLLDKRQAQANNVGNYAGSLAAPFESLINKLNELKDGLKNGKGAGGKTDQQSLYDANKAITVIEATLNRSSAAGTTSVKQVRNLTNAYKDLSITLGKSGSETTFLSTFGEGVAKAKNQVTNLNTELRLESSNTVGIDHVAESLNALAGIAQIAAGSYALFGANEEDAAKITSKLIAVQGIANTVQQFGQELTKKGTVVNKVYEGSLNLMSLAFGKGATAGQRFSAILKLTGIGLLITGVGFLISKFLELSSKTDLATESFKAYGEGVKEATLQLNKVKSAFDEAKEGVISKKEALKTYNDTLGDTFGKAKSLEEAEDNYTKKAPAYIKIMGLKAQANSLFAASAEQVAKGVTASTEDQTGFFDKAKAGFLAYFGEYNKAADISVKAQQAGIKDAQDKAQENADKLLAKGNEIAAQALLLQKQFGIKTDKPEGGQKTDKPKKIADNTSEELLKAQFETQKILIQRELDANKAILDDDTKTFAERLDAAKQYYANNTIIQNISTQEELANEELRFQKVKAGLLDQAKQKGADKKAINDQIAKEEYASSVITANIVLKGQDRIIKATEDFNKDLKRLKDARQALRKDEQDQIDEYEAFTQKAIAKALAGVIEGNKKLEAEGAKAADDKKKAIEDINAYAIKAAEETQATILAFITNGIDKENAALEKKKRLLDEDTARRINQIELLGLTEEERVKKTAEINKQAAYEKEQIEKRQRQLAVQRAKFEKAASIASIIANTAVAVVKTLSQGGAYAIPLALLIGALGALQLASAIATPIPQYRLGTDNAKKGLALVSEEGPELMKRNGQLFLTPSTPTLMEMAGGEQITPAGISNDILKTLAFSKQMRAGGVTALQPVGMSALQADEMISQLKQFNKDGNRPKIALHVSNDVQWQAYYMNNIKR